MSGLLKKYNLHKDCEWDGKVGQFRIVENRHSCTRPCDIDFYAYTKEGKLSKKSTAWIGFNPFDTDKDFERFIKIEGIKAVGGSNDEDKKSGKVVYIEPYEKGKDAGKRIKKHYKL